jgi:hypothetical protein
MGPTLTAGARARDPLAEWPAIDRKVPRNPYALCHLGAGVPRSEHRGDHVFWGAAIMATAAVEFGLTFLWPAKQQR